MCGIVGMIQKEDVVESLLEGLKRLEYRGYDSAGIATLETSNAHSPALLHRAFLPHRRDACERRRDPRNLCLHGSRR